MITIAICDDNELQTDLLGEILDEYIESRYIDCSVTKFNDGNSLLKTVREEGFFDIYILDMIMPGIYGMEVASTLRMLNDEGKIIFLTSTVEYAVNSYDVKAYYYMVKPVDTLKLYKILDGAISEISDESPKVVVRNGNRQMKLMISEIMYADINNRCPTYHSADGGTYTSKVIRGTFKEAMKPLIDFGGFYFCGISLVINTRYINAIDSVSILLRDGTLLYPSKQGIQELKKNIDK